MTQAIRHQIILARAEQTALKPTGRYITRDMNLFPEFVPAWQAKAAMWLRKGTDADVAKARAYAATEGYAVFTYPANERNALELAKAAVLSEKE